MSRQFLLSLRCQGCGERRNYTLADVVDRLRELHFLKREAEPSTELAMELAHSAMETGRWGQCLRCGSNRLGQANYPDEAGDSKLWGDVRHCVECGSPISPERLEVFPNAEVCMKCQSKVESKPSGNEHDYCPHCGDRMQLRAVQKPSTGYRMYCPSCRKTF